MTGHTDYGRCESPLLGNREFAPTSPGHSGCAQRRSSPHPVAVLGGGDFARSLARRLLTAGHPVVVGSRLPSAAAALFPPQVEVTTREGAAGGTAHLVLVAVPREHFNTLLPLADSLRGKVVVDVSNRDRRGATGPSNAEMLAEILPEARVVKAFNTLSAWSLQHGPRDASRHVPVCSDCMEAKAEVMQLARTLGFTPVDMGSLLSAHELEEIPLRLFPDWRMPVLLSLGLATGAYIYAFLQDVIHPFIMKQRSEFYRIPVELVNKTLPVVALVLLSLVYLPGVLAAVQQLRYRTKRRRFAPWLDSWLRSRKQLGLLSFFFAALHAIYSLALPLRRSYRYGLLNEAVHMVHKRIDTIWNDESVWRMEIYISLGIMAFGLLALLAVTSLPSVSAALNWREFTFIQSQLGCVALTVSTLHALMFGWKRAFEPQRYHFYMPPLFLLALPLPIGTLLGRLILQVPCLQRRLQRIRRGWEDDRHTQSIQDYNELTSIL
uniref:metalloreductase STEAP2-like isoform X1 n=1 Tax=Myxine glutinosa TaxID=7769 RepID=UPI00358FA6A3